MSFLGLAEWDTLGESLDALALANHRPVNIVGFAHPFHLKLAFSPKPISDDRAGQSMINYPAPPMQITRAPQLNNSSRPVTFPVPPTTLTNQGASDQVPQSKLPDLQQTREDEEPDQDDADGSKDAEKSPFDVRAVEAEEAAYLENHLQGDVASNLHQKGSSVSPVHRHQPPRTPDEEEDGDIEEIVSGGRCTTPEDEECSGGHVQTAQYSSSPNSQSEELTAYESPQLARKDVHQPPATPPSEPESSDAEEECNGEGDDDVAKEDR